MLVFLVGALTAIALSVPGSALAATYTWNVAQDFTATAPGANPDTDQYGGRPWSYVEGASDTPGAFSALPHFATGFDGGLSVWRNASSNSGALVGLNPGATYQDQSGNTFPGGQMVVEPGSGPQGQVAAVGWTSPFIEAQTVSIQGTISNDGSGFCNFPTWNLEDGSGTTISGNTGSSPSSFSTSATVAPGGSIYLSVSNLSNSFFACATGLSLQIQATGMASGITMTSPTQGSNSTVNGPTFSGAAGSDFGDSSQVILDVYSGSSASGAPVQTVQVPRSGGAWSATLPTPLAFGTYTAQAQQDDIVGDVGLTAPVTFTVGPPSVTLTPFATNALSTSTPTFTGMAATATTDQPDVVLLVFNGTSPTGTPILGLTVPVATSGQFSLRISPALPDGTYTAEALQSDTSGSTGTSPPLTFSIDTHAPTVTLVSPGKQSRSDALKLMFGGTAGSASYDSTKVTLSLYKGSKAKGKPFGTTSVPVTATGWSAKWPVLLANATYTVTASQTDAVGHVGVSAPHTFQVVAPPPVIGSLTMVGGHVNLKISCDEPATDTCSGIVKVLTRNNYQPVAGGPIGPLTVMFAFVSVTGESTATITRTVPARVAAALRHGAVPVTISANLHLSGGKAIRATARKSLPRRA